MKYEKGDKVVFELDRAGSTLLNENFDITVRAEQVLDKLEDFTKSTKIKMTVEEKKEFDKLLEEFEHSNTDLNDLLVDICDYSVAHPVLHTKLFENLTTFLDRKKQLEFARALEHPDLIEVEKPKKYYVHLFPGKYGYLNKLKNSGDYTINDKCKSYSFQVAFTKEEIDKIPQDAFKITDKALEEVPEDE